MQAKQKFFKLFKFNPDPDKKSVSSDTKNLNNGKKKIIDKSKSKSPHATSHKSVTESIEQVDYTEKIVALEKVIKEKDDEIANLYKELERLRNLLKAPFHEQNIGQTNLVQLGLISDGGLETTIKVPKDPAVLKKLLQILSDNIYMKNFDNERLVEIVHCMYIKEFNQDQIILREGDSGEFLSIVESGVLQLSKGDEVIGTLKAGKVFGEHSFLYNCVRSTNVKAITDVKLWVIDRATFETIMLKSLLSKQKEYLELLNKVPLFKNIPDHNLCKIINVMREIKYSDGEYIYRQGDKGDCLYIIKQGSVEFSRRPSNSSFSGPVFMRVLNQGQFFGEKSLLGEEYYLNDARATKSGCLLIQIERESFTTFIGNLNILRRDYRHDEAKASQNDHFLNDNQISITSTNAVSVDQISHNTVTSKFELNRRITLDDLHTVCTLGFGSFSKIEYVILKSDNRMIYALKQMKKSVIVSMNLQDQILSERKIMRDLSSNFVVKLIKTFKDRKYVYLLLEPCLGGPITNVIKEKIHLSESLAKFYTACIVEAIRYLHKIGIVYRDLKPSNVLLDERGYCKLSGFMYAKKITFGRRTFSFCGTPEYIAPEVILNKGHDFAVDLWGIGVLMYEMLSGRPPFVGSDPIKTYNLIMRGLESANFPSTIPRNAVLLIKKFCRIHFHERIGYGKNNFYEIQKHKWFEGFSWNNLQNMVMDAPHLPDKWVSSACMDDDDNDYLREDDIPPDETSGWDKDF